MSDLFKIDGNQLVLLQNGTEYFPQLCADIDAAQSFVYLESYIFAADQAGRMVALSLQKAAQRGLIVHVLIDGFGSGDLPQASLDELQSAGVKVHLFRREIYRFKLRRHRLRRLHRKLVVLDGKVAFIGGINIIDDLTSNGRINSPRFDFAVRVEGSLAAEIHAVTRRMWIAVSWARGLRRERFSTLTPDICPHLALLLRDNLRHRRDIERAYLMAIAGAHFEIVIANAYFLPGGVFRRTLIQAARRGVRVVLLLQGRVEHRLLYYATHALYLQLLQAGIEIYEYQASFLHAKVAVIDGRWATVGSSNIDPFSLLLAREANLVVSDTGFASSLRYKLFAAISQHAQRIDLAHWKRFNWGARRVAKLSYALIRIMIGILGYGKHR